MKENQPILPWLEHLFQLIPSSGLILVGAGPGNSKWLEYLRERPEIAAKLVEADPVQFKCLERVASNFPNWQISKEVIAQHRGPVAFYQSSLSSENSLIEPDALRGIWPNLTAHQTLDLHAITLEDLLCESPAPVNCLLIDCLPAKSIIESAHAGLDSVNIIVARVVIGVTEGQLASASLCTLQAYMEQCGYRLLSVETTRHPSLGHALFIRGDCLDGHKLKEKNIQIEALSETNLAIEARQRLIDEELENAKCQIELIEKLLKNAS